MSHLVFSHGNGFPAGTYSVLMDAWRAAGWTVSAVERFGHDPQWPVSSNWPRLRDQLVAHIEAQAAPGPVVLVGHSLGGFLSLLAACKRPDLARAVVLLDSPIIGGWRAHSIHMAKLTRLIQRVSPAKVALRRRQHWPDREAMRAHFAAKHVFARWDPRVLDAYTQAGAVPAPEGGITLAFERQVEARIYNTLPHHLPALLHRHPPRCPVTLIAGRQSTEVRQVGLAASRALVRERLHWLDGTHLFPMERPDETATRVLDLIGTPSPLPHSLPL